jgi:tetratricopeptide (TPR) repeat protein
MIAALLIALACAQAPAAQVSDEDAVRALVQQHYDAQARAGDDVVRVDVRRVEIEGATAHVRMLVERTHTGTDRAGAARPQRTSTFMFETWTRDGTSWKLETEEPLADAVADALLAAPPEQWVAMLAAEDPVVVLGPLRMAVGTHASTAAASQQYAKALPLFTLLREIGRFAAAPRIELEALQNLGTANFFLRRYPDAADAYAQELALARKTHDEDYEATALDGGAMVAYSRGDYTSALDGYRGALEIAERNREPSAIGRALVSVGNVQYLQGDYDLAAASYRRAISLLADAHDARTAAMAWRGAARVYVAQGDLAAALVSQTHALDDARAHAAHSEIANDQESIGEIHFRLGNANEARKAFDESRQLFDADKDLDSAGRLFGDIGLTELMAERFDAAVAAYTESRKRFQDARDPAGIGHSWVGIGFSEAARGRFDDAIDAYRIAIGIFNAGGRKEDAGRAWLGLSLAHYAAGDYTSALDDAGHVAEIASGIHSDDLTWRASVRAGDALRRLDRLGDAAARYADAIAAIKKIVPFAATNADARTALDDSASAWAGLAFTRAAQGDAEGALLAAEQRRTHALRVMLAPFLRDITRGMTSEDASTERAALRGITSLNAQLRAERLAPQPDRTRIDRIERQLNTAEAARDGQQRCLQE